MSTIELHSRTAGVPARLAWLTWAVVAVILGLAGAFYLPFPVNHDAAWIVMGAERMLDGAAFGREVIDVNPPLAWWLSMPAVVLSRLTGLALGPAFLAYTLAIGLGCLALSARVLAAQDRDMPGIALIVIACVFWLLPAYDFGQREHFMLMLATPYVLLCAGRGAQASVHSGLAVICGLLAGFAFCLKPYFLVIPAGLAVFTVLRTRRLGSLFAIENLVIAGVGAAYAAAIVRFAPDYLSTIVPEAMVGYGAYANALLPVAKTYLVLLAPALVGVALLGKRFSGHELPLPGLYALFAALLAAIAAIVQQKGWSYHIMPAIGFGLIAGGIGLAGLAKSAGGLARPATIAAIALMALALVRPVQGQLRDLVSPVGNHAVTAELTDRLRDAGPVAGAYAFITSPRNVHPAVLSAGANWATPACCVYLLPAHIRDGDVSDHLARRAVAMRQVSGVIETLARKQPAIILVDDREHKLGFGGMAFSYLEWLDGKPGFADLWAHYREDARAGHFRVFVRKRR
jgi:hypothetical protein